MGVSVWTEISGVCTGSMNSEEAIFQCQLAVRKSKTAGQQQMLSFVFGNESKVIACAFLRLSWLLPSRQELLMRRVEWSEALVLEPYGSVHCFLRWTPKEMLVLHPELVSPQGNQQQLRRQAPVQQQKKRPKSFETILGHCFVKRHFYKPVCCSLCQRIVLSGTARQCMDCNLLGHHRCLIASLRTKCPIPSQQSDQISPQRPNDEAPETGLPHAWTPHTSKWFAPQWCDHCGSLITVFAAARKRSISQCRDCHVIVHEECSKLVAESCILSDSHLLIASEPQSRASRSPQGGTTPEPCYSIAVPKKTLSAKSSVSASATANPIDQWKLLATLGRGNFGKVATLTNPTPTMRV